MFIPVLARFCNPAFEGSVNWEIVSHAVNDITSISVKMKWAKMNRYGQGVWAGAIRYHNKRFWIYFSTPDEDYFMTTAKKAEGLWQPLHHVLAKKRWDDYNPFRDDDRQGYLVGTNFSDHYKIRLFKMTVNGEELIEGSDQVIYQSQEGEANKLYKMKDTYYHFFSEVKPEGRAIMMERAKNIYGPYTELKQLSNWRALPDGLGILPGRQDSDLRLQYLTNYMLTQSISSHTRQFQNQKHD